jgi:hypothetical protein
MTAATDHLAELLGVDTAPSPAGVVQHLILSLNRRQLAIAPSEPKLEPPWVDSMYAVPASTWCRAESVKVAADSFAGLRGAPWWCRAFDRSGSFLSAWGGVKLPYGEWSFYERARLREGPERDIPPGYWLVDRSTAWRPAALPDPLWRQGVQENRVWVTTPMLQLLRELAAASHQTVSVEVGIVTQDSRRALDAPAEALRRVRTELIAKNGEGDAKATLAALKTGYAAGTSWFEFGPGKQAGPLRRPSWRRTIIDRYVANTYRALAKCSPLPFALTDVDTAFFWVESPTAVPTGLRIGSELGAWKPKGEAIPAAQVARVLAENGPKGLAGMARA